MIEYKTHYKNYLLLIKQDPRDSTYTIWQCDSNWNQIAGWGGYPNMTQALKDFKSFVSK